jgi:hypothetical protein
VRRHRLGEHSGAARRALLEAALLGVAPVAAFLVLHIRSMAASTMIDPAFYTAYLQNGRELMDRFGPGNYYWVRVGFIVPAHVSWRLFGPLGGFYAFRYVLALLAIVPAYLLFRRLHGVAAGWTAVLVVLTCPVVLTAWGSDYPDSAAVSYLLGGTACLLMPAAGRRWPWVMGAGALFALALHCQVIAVFAVAGPVVACLAVLRRRPVRGMALEALLLTAAGAAVTLVLVAASRRLYGDADIFTPTLRQFLVARQPAEIAVFHSTTWKWLLYDVYVLVPPVLAAAWLAVSWRAREGTPQETAIALGSLLAFSAHAVLQFAAQAWTLEYYLYTSLLFSGSCLLMSALVVRMSGPLLRSRPWALAPAASVVAVPLLLRPFRSAIQFELPLALAIAAAVIAVAMASRTRRTAVPWRAGLVAAAIAGVTALTTGMPLQRPLFPGQAAYFTPDYGSVLFGDGHRAVDEYALASQLRTVVPSARAEPGDMALWWAPRHDPVVDHAAAQYLWYSAALRDTLPDLDGAQAGLLATRRVRWLVLLSDDGREFAPAMDRLSAGGFEPRTARERTFASGGLRMRVRVIELTAFPAPR